MANELLTGPTAGEILAVAVEAAGGRLIDWKPAELDATAASYRVRIGSKQGERTEILALGTRIENASGVTLVGDGSRRVGIWRAADDPELPGLRRVMDPLVAARLLTTFGLAGGAEDVLVRPRLRAYRPLRRAVVELSGRLFVKAVPPAKVRAALAQPWVRPDLGRGPGTAEPRVDRRRAGGAGGTARSFAAYCVAVRRVGRSE
jgi:hypothetical protein